MMASDSQTRDLQSSGDSAPEIAAVKSVLALLLSEDEEWIRFERECRTGLQELDVYAKTVRVKLVEQGLRYEHVEVEQAVRELAQQLAPDTAAASVEPDPDPEPEASTDPAAAVPDPAGEEEIELTEKEQEILAAIQEYEQVRGVRFDCSLKMENYLAYFRRPSTGETVGHMMPEQLARLRQYRQQQSSSESAADRQRRREIQRQLRERVRDQVKPRKGGGMKIVDGADAKTALMAVLAYEKWCLPATLRAADEGLDAVYATARKIRDALSRSRREYDAKDFEYALLDIVKEFAPKSLASETFWPKAIMTSYEYARQHGPLPDEELDYHLDRAEDAHDRHDYTACRASLQDLCHAALRRERASGGRDAARAR